MSGTTMYLYNGVKLPDVNTVWTDKETYPYAFITPASNGEYLLHTQTGPIYWTGFMYMYKTWGSKNLYYISDGKWVADTVHGSYTAVQVATEVLWTANDIMADPETVYLAATTPIPVLPGVPYNQAFRNFLAAGIVCETLWPGVEEKSAVQMYSYNGVVLPDINTVWTPELKKTHPFAVIKGVYKDDVLQYYRFFITETRPYIVKNDNIAIVKTIDGTYGAYTALVGGSSWSGGVLQFSGTGVYNITNGNDSSFGWPTNDFAVWTNTDVLNPDGTVYLAATDPIPIYE